MDEVSVRSAMSVMQRGDGKVERTRRIVRRLGWLSLGAGLPALSAPGAGARLMGLREDDTTRALVFAVGLRETACGVSMLAWPRFAGWVWMRVAGDAMDLAALGWALASGASTRRNRTVATTAATAGIAALDLWSALGASRRAASRRHPYEYAVEAKRAITVNRSREEVYQAWRDLRNLPRFMQNLEAVEMTGENRSHWVAKAPAGTSVEWDAQITDDQPNERISWRSLPGSQVENAGSVRFTTAPGERGTEVHVEIRYTPPAGKLGAVVAKIFGKDAGQQMASDLRRFKQVMETGEIARSAVSARGGGPAQPSLRTEPMAPMRLPTEPARS